MYCDKEFRNTFINVDFDEIFINNNNELVNHPEYLKIKQDYLNQTNENFNKFKHLLEEYNLIVNNYTVKNNKYTYMHIDEEKLDFLNDELKNLKLKQQKLLANILNFIKVLNKLNH